MKNKKHSHLQNLEIQTYEVWITSRPRGNISIESYINDFRKAMIIMTKLTKILLLLFSIIMLFSCIFLYRVLNPTLNSIQVSEENEDGIYISPDGEKSITVYFNGGLLFYNDLTYVGVLEDFNTGLRKNIFLEMPNVKEVRWINNGTIVVNGIEIAIDDTYDFRNE